MRTSKHKGNNMASIPEEIAFLESNLLAIDKAAQLRRDAMSIYEFRISHLSDIRGHRLAYMLMSTGWTLFQLRVRTRWALWLIRCCERMSSK